MAKPRAIPFWRDSGGGDRSPQVSASKLTNWYLEPRQNAPYPFVLYPTPGLRLFAAAGNGPCRGIHPFNGDIWVVSGTRIYQVTSAGVATDRGEVTGTGHVAMASNATHILVTTTGANSYAVNSSEIVSIPEPDLRGATYQDGYGIASRNEQFYISEIDDMKTWSALAFSSADAFPDKIVGIRSINRILWMFGQNTIEQWYNSGNALFPFQRAGGGFIEKGCLSDRSIAVADNVVYWLGDDNSVYRAVGAQPVPVSTAAISRIIAESNSPQTASAFVYKIDEHLFYCLSLSNVTIEYDITTGLWHNRKSFGFDRWRATGHAWQWRKNIVGDTENGKLYELDTATYDEGGETIVREAISEPIGDNASYHSMHSLLVDLEAGQGLDGGVQGSDPHVMMSQSRDHGRTYGPELTRSFGKIGEYDHRAKFARLGRARQRVIKLSVSDPVKAVVCGVWAETEGFSA